MANGNGISEKMSIAAAGIGHNEAPQDHDEDLFDDLVNKLIEVLAYEDAVNVARLNGYGPGHRDHPDYNPSLYRRKPKASDELTRLDLLQDRMNAYVGDLPVVTNP